MLATRSGTTFPFSVGWLMKQNAIEQRFALPFFSFFVAFADHSLSLSLSLVSLLLPWFFACFSPLFRYFAYTSCVGFFVSVLQFGKILIWLSRFYSHLKKCHFVAVIISHFIVCIFIVVHCARTATQYICAIFHFALK